MLLSCLFRSLSPDQLQFFANCNACLFFQFDSYLLSPVIWLFWMKYLVRCYTSNFRVILRDQVVLEWNPDEPNSVGDFVKYPSYNQSHRAETGQWPPITFVPFQRLRIAERGGRRREQPAGVRRGWARVWHPASDPGRGDGCRGWTGQAADGSLPVQVLRGLQELRSGSFLLLSWRARTGSINVFHWLLRSCKALLSVECYNVKKCSFESKNTCFLAEVTVNVNGES